MKIDNFIKETRKQGRLYFTLEQLIAQLDIRPEYAYVLTHRALAQGDIISPARGLYVIVPPECHRFGSIPAEELVPIIMSYYNAEYYVALFSAASYYGATHQKVFLFQVITNKRIYHPLVFKRIKIQVIYKKTLKDLPTVTRPVASGMLRVATPELVVLDMFQYQKRSGGLNRIATVLSELVEALDPDKLVQLAEQLGAVRAMQRLGCILNQIATLDQDKKEDIISALQAYLAKNSHQYTSLASHPIKEKVVRNALWKVVESIDVESDV